MKHKFAALAALTGLMAVTGVSQAKQMKFVDTHSSTYAMLCQSPVLQPSDNPADPRTLFTIDCEGDRLNEVLPRITFSGQVASAGDSPYLVDATYKVDARTEHERALGITTQLDQVVGGHMTLSTESIAILPKQFAEKAKWDSQSNMLSLEVSPGKWHVLGVNHLASAKEGVIVDAGFVSAPLINGKTHANIVFDKRLSRFAAAGDDAPQLKAHVTVRDYALELDIQATRAGAKKGIQDALKALDRNSSDMSRAWALAAQAKFLGMEQELRYAQKKVAAKNPHLLEEFQHNLEQIVSQTLPREPSGLVTK